MIAVVFTGIIAALVGLAVGSFLDLVAYRLPRRISLLRESRCPHCRSRIRWYQCIPVISFLAMKGRCGVCWEHISPRYPIVEGVTGLLFGVVALGVGLSRPAGQRAVDETSWFGSPEFWGILVTLETFAALSIVLVLLQLDRRRLPDAIVLPGWGVVIGMLLVTTLLAGLDPMSEPSTTSGVPLAPDAQDATIDWFPFLRALIGGGALCLAYFIVRLAGPQLLSRGAVKLAGLSGTMLGWYGWTTLALGAVAPLLLAGAYTLAVRSRRARRRTPIPYGTWIPPGAWLGIALGEPMVSAWVMLTG